MKPNKPENQNSDGATGPYSQWAGEAGKGKTSKALHIAKMREINSGARAGRDELWRTEYDHRDVQVLAVFERYAMVRRPKCEPYVCNVKELFERF